MRFAKPKLRMPSDSRQIRLGFAPTIAAASVIAAAELGLFAQYGLEVTLERELGSGSLREALLQEELEAALIAPNAGLRTYYGWGSLRRHCITGLWVGSSYTSLVLSREMLKKGIHDPDTLRHSIQNGSLAMPPMIGVLHESPEHRRHVLEWLRRGGISSDQVRWIMMSSALLYDGLKQGLLDACSAAEPWMTLAVTEGLGGLAAEIPGTRKPVPTHALFVLKEFSDTQPDQTVKLIASLIEAGRFCDAAANHDWLATTLAQPHYLNISSDVIIAALRGTHRASLPSVRDPVATQFTFSRGNVGRPSLVEAKTFVNELRSTDASSVSTDSLARIYREDLYDQALELSESFHRSRRGYSGAISEANPDPSLYESPSPTL